MKVNSALLVGAVRETETVLAKFEQCLTTLDVVHSKIESLSEVTDIEEEVASAAYYRRKVTKIRTAAQLALEKN